MLGLRRGTSNALASPLRKSCDAPLAMNKGGPHTLSVSSPPGVVGSRGEQPDAPTTTEGVFVLHLHNGGTPISRQHDGNNINQVRNHFPQLLRLLTYWQESFPTSGFAGHPAHTATPGGLPRLGQHPSRICAPVSLVPSCQIYI
jgi:hypothetical protein